MLFKKMSLLSLVAVAFAGVAFADQRQPVQQQPRQFEGTQQKGFMHYEGDMEDNLANPLDSTNEELEEEEAQIRSYERKPVNQQPNGQYRR